MLATKSFLKHSGPVFSIAGGTAFTYSGTDYEYKLLTGSSSFDVTGTTGSGVKLLLIAGGGPGGDCIGGGGGAGGYKYWNNLSPTVGTYNYVIGTPQGTAATQGNHSTITGGVFGVTTHTATGGGYGGQDGASSAGGSGGSGGGVGYISSSPGSGTTNQGYNGSSYEGSHPNITGGGGGGASQAAPNSDGGNGITFGTSNIYDLSSTSSITSSAIFADSGGPNLSAFGGGGGGGKQDSGGNPAGVGGAGGGGTGGAPSVSGSDATGYGSGGGGSGNGANDATTGSSGVLIIIWSV